MATENSTDCDTFYQPIYLRFYQILIILIGVIGNGFVIYASKQYSTFNLDSNTIFLVRHLGYADIGILLLGFLPASFMFREASDQSDPGNTFTVICTIQGLCMNVFGLSVLSITAFISVHRLLRCTLPQIIARIRRRKMLVLVLGCYMGALLVTVGITFLSGLKYQYEHGYYSCIASFEVASDESLLGHSLSAIVRGVGMTLSALFFLVIIIINILLHYYSKKKLKNLAGNSLKKHKTSRYRTLTTHSISALLIFTWLPFATIFFVTISRIESEDQCPNKIISYFSTFAINFYLLNFALNPFLYCVTNINFMKFVMKLLKRNCNNCLCVNFCKKISPDLELSTNISTMDLPPASSNTCPVAVDRIYSNMLTVPDQADGNCRPKRKLLAHKTKSHPAYQAKHCGSACSPRSPRSKVQITISGKNSPIDADGVSSDSGSYFAGSHVSSEPCSSEPEPKVSKVVRITTPEPDPVSSDIDCDQEHKVRKVVRITTPDGEASSRKKSKKNISKKSKK